MTSLAFDRPNIVMMPPLAALTGLILCVTLHFIWKPWWLPGFPNLFAIVIGIGIIAGGFVIAHAATNSFHDADTNVNPLKPALKLVTDGPYRFIRNPMYLGLLMVHFGIGLAGSLDWTLVVTPALWVFLHFGAVLWEEAYLTEKFGDEYLALLSRTRRWI